MLTQGHFNVQGHSRSWDQKRGATTKANEKVKITLYCCVPLCLWAPKLTTKCSFTCIDKLLFHMYQQTALSHVSFARQDEEGVVGQYWMRWRTTVQSKKRQWGSLGSVNAAKVQASVARWIKNSIRKMLLCRLLLLWQSTVAMVQMLWKHSVAINPLLLQNRHCGAFCCYKSVIAMVQLPWQSSFAMVQTFCQGNYYCYGAHFCCHGNHPSLWCKIPLL